MERPNLALVPKLPSTPRDLVRHADELQLVAFILPGYQVADRIGNPSAVCHALSFGFYLDPSSKESKECIARFYDCDEAGQVVTWQECTQLQASSFNAAFVEFRFLKVNGLIEPKPVEDW